MEFLIKCMDDLSMEQQKVSYCDILFILRCCSILTLRTIFNVISYFIFTVSILLPEPVSSASATTSLAPKEKVGHFDDRVLVRFVLLTRFYTGW